jgi:hypothetical protein
MHATPILAARFARSTTVLRSEAPLLEEQMRLAAPSILRAGQATAKREENEERLLPPEQRSLRNTPPARSPSQTQGLGASARGAVPRNRVKAIQTDAAAQSPGGASNGLTTSYALLAEPAGKLVEVVVDCAPSEDGHVFVRTNGASPKQAVPATHLKLIRLVPRDAR